MRKLNRPCFVVASSVAVSVTLCMTKNGGTFQSVALEVVSQCPSCSLTLRLTDLTDAERGNTRQTTCIHSIVLCSGNRFKSLAEVLPLGGTKEPKSKVQKNKRVLLLQIRI